MDAEKSNHSLSDANVFSRGSLQLTYDLIRKINPSLALNVRNIMATERLPKEASQTDNKNSDHFKVTLDSFQVRAIVEGLMECQMAEGQKNNPGMELMSKTLTEDWMALAHKMIAELPK